MTRHKGTPQRQLRDWKRRRLRKRRKDDVAFESWLEEERAIRDMRVTSEYGEHAHYSCGRKYRYETEQAALTAAAKRVLNGAPTLRAYHCELCGGWHLTKRQEE